MNSEIIIAVETNGIKYKGDASKEDVENSFHAYVKSYFTDLQEEYFEGEKGLEVHVMECINDEYYGDFERFQDLFEEVSIKIK